MVNNEEKIGISQRQKKTAQRHTIIDIHKSKHSIYGIIQSINGNIYTPFVHYTVATCGCKYFYYTQSICSHLYKLLQNNTHYINQGEHKMIPRYTKTSLEGINELMGGLPVGSPTGIYGHPASGKTIFSNQMVFEMMYKYKNQEQRNGLIIDTEGSTHTLVGWHKIFNKKYKLKTDIIFIEPKVIKTKAGRGYSRKLELTYSLLKKNKTTEIDPEDIENQTLFVMDIRNVKKLMIMLGRGSHLVVSKKGKITIKADDKFWMTEIEDTPLYKLIKENNIKVLDLDSISYPMQIFGNERMNFPERATASNWIMAPLHNISEELNIVSFIIAHETIDPSDAYGKPEYTGGKAIKHSLKFILYMSETTSSNTPRTNLQYRPPTVREVWNKRHPVKMGWAKPVFINLTDKGFVDFDPDEE